MDIPIRKAVRVLLLNNKKELLLMCVEGFDISTSSGKRHNRFWCTVGGGIEADESIEHAALREIYEETGLDKENITLGPIVWHGIIDLQLKGKLTRFDESFIIAHAKNNHVFLHKPTFDEKNVVKELKWFSIKEIKKSNEIIFPVILRKYLQDILDNNYPREILEIDLSIEPN